MSYNKDYAKKYRETHRAEINESNRLYRLNHKELSAKWQGKYRDSLRFAGLRSKVLNRDGWKCTACGMTNDDHILKWNRQLTLHHRNGKGRYSIADNKLSNLQTLCLSCHGKIDVNRYWRTIYG